VTDQEGAELTRSATVPETNPRQRCPRTRIWKEPVGCRSITASLWTLRSRPTKGPGVDAEKARSEDRFFGRIRP